jgi:Protein of unknown function (DUF1571)
MPRNVARRIGCLVSMKQLVAIVFWIALNASVSLAQTRAEPVKAVASKGTPENQPAADEAHPLYIPLQMAYQAKEPLSEIRDYECVFTKRELIGKKLVKTSMRLKFRDEPFSVYLKFLDTNAGREVLYVKGQNNNNLLVREAGIKALVGVVTLSPTGPDAMTENRHPVSSIGMKEMLNMVIKQWEAEAKFGGTTTQKRPDSKLPTGEICTVYESVHEKPYKDFKFHTTRLWIDDKSGLAIGVQQLGFPGKNDKEPPTVEEYFYSDLKLNRNLTDADFDKSNKSYSFR